MRMQSGRWGAVACAAAVALGMAAGLAQAQESAVKPDAASKNNVQGAGSGSGGGSPNTVIDSGNGVAGTGMGKMPMKGSSAGTGNSVKGPPGQGISNSTDTTQ